MGSVKRSLALVLSVILVIILLTGCSSDIKTESPTAAITPETTPEVSIAPSNDAGETEQVKVEGSEAIDVLSGEQKNSLNMMNYLAFITQEILSKKNNRVYLKEVYSSLQNNIKFSQVNDITEEHYGELQDHLHEFDKLLTKRERLQYLFEQSQAQALRSAIPNPLGLLSAVKSMNVASLVTSVVYMTVDAVSKYSSGMSSAEEQFLQGSWELDDDESDTIHSMKKQATMYAIEVVKGYHLPDELALTEEKVELLVKWEEERDANSPASRVFFFETHEKEFEGFGQYWLARAKAHYDNKEFDKCLKCIQKYEDLKIDIYRNDYELIKVLPIAIGAASQIYDDATYVETAGRYADMIIANSRIKDEWALRYFVAQTYLDIYSRTEDLSYLRKAYTIALENANELKSEQNKLNNTYIADLIPEEIPAGTEKARKEQIEAYNKQKKLERETELPPVYEPLKLNLDLLYALADRLNLSEADRKNMDDILYTDGKSLFISKAVDSLYREIKGNAATIEYTGKDLTIPVDCLTSEAKMSVTAYKKNQESVVLDDWQITKVERKEKENVSSYIATYHSKKAESLNYMDYDHMSLLVKPFGNLEQMSSYTVNIKKSKDLYVFDKVEFEVVAK